MFGDRHLLLAMECVPGLLSESDDSVDEEETILEAEHELLDVLLNQRVEEKARLADGNEIQLGDREELVDELLILFER